VSQASLEDLIADGRTNAAIAWGLVSAIAAVGVGALVTGSILWTTFAVALVVLALFPPLALQSPQVMLPWEVLLLAALPIFDAGLGVGMTGYVTSYLSVAAIALVLAVELQTFTAVQMTSGFAIIFVVITTMAAAALWALFRWSVAGILGVPFPADHDAIMWEFVYSAVGGLVAGVVFELYFRRLGRAEHCSPTDDTPIARGEDA